MEDPDFPRYVSERQAAERARRHAEHLVKRTIYRHRRLL
jgi:hypothetical protein